MALFLYIQMYMGEGEGEGEGVGIEVEQGRKLGAPLCLTGLPVCHVQVVGF